MQCSVVFLPGAPTNYVGLGTGADSWLRWKLVERTLQGHYIINITLTEILTLDTLWDWLNFIQVTSHQLPFVTLALAYCTAWQVGRGLQIGAPLSSAGDSQQDGDLDLQLPPIPLSPSGINYYEGCRVPPDKCFVFRQHQMLYFVKYQTLIYEELLRILSISQMSMANPVPVSVYLEVAVYALASRC